MAGGWDKAYLRQAQSDYDVFRRLLPLQVPECHKLHYLQMASEKLAKAIMSASQRGHRQPNKHESLIRSFRLVGSYGPVRRALGYSSKNDYASFIRSVTPVAQAIEDLYPKGIVDRPNPEYPWESNGRVICPIDYRFAHLDLLKGSNVKQFLWYLERCLKTAETWLVSAR